MQDEQKTENTAENEAPAADTAAGAESAEQAQAAEATPSLEEQLKAARLAAEEHHDAWLRARAEADNIRKRAQQDIANAHKYAIEGFASNLTAVRDSLEAALAADPSNVEALRSGVELTLRQLNSAFEKANLIEVNPLNEKFDPNRHQAMSMVESDIPSNTVVQVLQKGYALHDRVLRPALVIVSKGKQS